MATVRFLYVAAIVSIVSCSLENVALPDIVEFGKIYGSGGAMTDDNVIGYTFMIDRNGADVNASWARAVPNPHGDQYTYQPVTGKEPNVTVLTNVDAEFDTMNTHLNFNHSQYNNLSKIQFVLRLSIDHSRGPVDIFLFPQNDDLYETPLPQIKLPQSATYMVPDNQSTAAVEPDVWTQLGSQATERSVDIDHTLAVTVPKKESTPEIEIIPTFVRVYQEFRPTGFVAGEEDYYLVVPKEPFEDQKKYSHTSTPLANGTVIIRQSFSVSNASKNNTGLYQFDVKVQSAKGPLYQVSSPFLLRRTNYRKQHQGVLPCSPYRGDANGLYLFKVGFQEGDLPCVRFFMLEQNGGETTTRFRFIRDDYHNTKPEALNNDRKGLYDVKDRFFVINDPEEYVPWFDIDRDTRNSIALISSTASVPRRQTSFIFIPYHAVQLIDTPTEVDDTTVTFHCDATWPKTLKVVRVKKNFYDQFKNGLSSVDIWYLKDLRSLRVKYSNGVLSSDRSSEDINGERSYSAVVKFNKERMRRLFRDGYTVACVAYNEFDLRSKLLSR